MHRNEFFTETTKAKVFIFRSLVPKTEAENKVLVIQFAYWLIELCSDCHVHRQQAVSRHFS